MKRLMVWIVALAAFAAGFAFADATAFRVTGSVSAKTGPEAARVVRQGDTLRPGDSVITGVGSSAVLKFDDGQIAAIGPNSQMVIDTYYYDRSARTGNIALRLLRGGMRAITGFIGRNQPKNVTYKAGNFTIGIRGTDVTIATEDGDVVVTVLEGIISFSFGDQTIEVRAGEGVNARADGTFQSNAIDTILRQLQSTPQGQRLLDDIGGVNALAAAVSQAAAGVEGELRLPTTPGPFAPASTGGGGTASNR